VSKAIFYRRSEDELTFKRIATLPNAKDCISIVDGTIQYAKNYTYRVFLENIHGTFSEPGEIDFISTVQKITPGSRSNNLKIPIITALQDQNSDFIKITISANDPNVSFYELTRRDLSIHERKFSVPEKLYGESPSGDRRATYGGTGWATNKFFVDRPRNIVKTATEEKNRDVLHRQSEEGEIVFIDDTVQIGHIYQYRVRGCDLFCNPSSYAHSLIKVTGKKSLRSPINLQSQLLRANPFRIKVSWSDDNLSTEFSASELFEGKSDIDKKSSKVIYKIQRRKLGETVYETFPLTANKYFVDEVATMDAVDFTPEKKDDDTVVLPNTEATDDSITISSELSRPFGIPNFLKENDIYFYRVAAISSIGEESNFSPEFKVLTLPDLSDPINFRAEVENTRVRPLVAHLSWQTERNKAGADRYTIEKKFDTLYDSFEIIGTAYLENEFYDRDLEPNSTYIYRIKAIDNLGRESNFFEARLTI
jgi:hypothetical protein